MDVGQSVGDVGHRLVPCNGLEAIQSTAQGGGDAIRIVDDLGEGDALLAGKPRRQRMVLIGAQRDQSTVFDGRDHAAQRLADPAEGRLLLSRHCSSRERSSPGMPNG
jgi:hypothetical protein